MALVPNTAYETFPLPVTLPESPLTRTSSTPAPWFEPGSMYKSEFLVPILGAQTFLLDIVDESAARIRISGILKLDDMIQYDINEDTGEISFSLAEKTQRVLRRFGTRLGSVGYDSERDEAMLKVQPPLPISITLLFQRVFTH